MKKLLYIFMSLILLLSYGCQKLKDEIARITGGTDDKKITATLKQAEIAQNKLKFVFVNAIKGTVCIPGVYTKGTMVTLLEKGKPNVLLASADDKFDYDDEMNGPDSCTKLTSAPSVTTIENYSIGVVQSRIDSYDLGEIKDITDDNLRKNLDQKIRLTDILQKLLLQNSGASYDVNKDIAKSVPVVNQYVIPGLSVYIVHID